MEHFRLHLIRKNWAKRCSAPLEMNIWCIPGKKNKQQAAETYVSASPLQILSYLCQKPMPGPGHRLVLPDVANCAGCRHTVQTEKITTNVKIIHYKFFGFFFHKARRFLCIYLLQRVTAAMISCITVFTPLFFACVTVSQCRRQMSLECSAQKQKWGDDWD